MTDLTESLMSSYQTREASVFAKLAARLNESSDERQQVAEELLKVACEGDVRRAEIAIDILIVTGMAREDKWFERLITAAETIFSPAVLSTLVADEGKRLKGTRKAARISPHLRILRSVIGALVRKGGTRATGFVNAVEAQLAETPLASRIAKWRHS